MQWIHYSFPKLIPWGQEQEHVYKSKGQSHAGCRELTNGVLRHICRKKRMIGYSHNIPRKKRWLVKNTLAFLSNLADFLSTMFLTEMT